MYDPLGMGPANNSAMGSPGVTITVTPEVVPVRLVYSAPIPVIVTNFPGLPPPLAGGLRPTMVPPPLPRRIEPPQPKKAEGDGLLSIVGKISAAVTAAYVVAKPYLDVFTRAAGGFNTGVERGSGQQVLGKSFELLGTTVGVVLLPAMLRLSGTAIALANMFERVENSAFGRWMQRNNDPGAGGLIEKFLELPERQADAVLPGHLSIVKGLLTKAFTGEGTLRSAVGKGMVKDERAGYDLALQSLRQSLGSQASYLSIADVRSQAQMAGLQQDPIERRIKELMLKWLEKQTGGDGGGPTFEDMARIMAQFENAARGGR